MAKETLHILHASMQVKDSAAATRDDYAFVFSKGADIISFTETNTRNGNSQIMSQEARQRDYIPITGIGSNQLAVRTRPGVRVKDRGRIKSVTDRYGGRHIAWVRVNFFGVDIFHHGTHWPIGPDQTPARMAKLRADMLRLIKGHTKYGLCTFAGDLNADPDQDRYPTRWFRENHLVTMWQDAGVQVATHGRGATIDYIGRYGLDRTMDFRRYKVWPRQNSDHRPLSAWYDIEVAKKPSAAPGAKPPSPAPIPVPAPVYPERDYATGGNVDWSDYTDDELYALPYAVDDSDLVNG